MKRVVFAAVAFLCLGGIANASQLGCMPLGAVEQAAAKPGGPHKVEHEAAMGLLNAVNSEPPETYLTEPVYLQDFPDRDTLVFSAMNGDAACLFSAPGALRLKLMNAMSGI